MSRSNKRIDYSKDEKSSNRKNTHVYDGKSYLQNLAGGDLEYIPNFIKSKAEKDRIFTALLHEIQFTQMFNFFDGKVEPIPRMISAQTDKSSSKSLIYRMPGCNESNIPTTDWTETVRAVVNKASVDIDQELNHCVATLFRDADDSLAFHQDKELDLKDKSLIVSISFGETRPIVFEEIDGKTKITIYLQPGSLLVFGPKTNSRFRHAILKLTSPVGPRISLSVRSITTYIEKKNDEEFHITGKGEQYQVTNYPFIKSHDKTSEYTEEIKNEIEQCHREKQEALELLRIRYPLIQVTNKQMDLPPDTDDDLTYDGIENCKTKLAETCIP